MKYQIQQYHEQDFSQRKVVSEIKGTFTEKELSTWYQQTTFGIVVPEGQKLALVAEDHEWFIQATQDAVLGPNLSLNKTEQEIDGFEGKLLTFEEVSIAEREADTKRRAERIELQKEVMQLLSKLK